MTETLTYRGYPGPVTFVSAFRIYVNERSQSPADTPRKVEPRVRPFRTRAPRGALRYAFTDSAQAGPSDMRKGTDPEYFALKCRPMQEA